MTQIIVGSKAEQFALRVEMEKILLKSIKKNGEVLCFLCNKKIDPSLPEEMFVGKRAHFYHRNCKRRLDERNNSKPGN